MLRIKYYYAKWNEIKNRYGKESLKKKKNRYLQFGRKNNIFI